MMMERVCSVVVELNALSKEELAEMSMVETAYALMVSEHKSYNFYDLLEEVAKRKGLSKSEMDAKISFLYTDLNIDGRFLTLGDNQWGLKAWYPHEQSEEEITSSVKPAKRRKKNKDDEDEDYLLDDELEEDEFEDLEDELDELADEEDQDDDEEDDSDEFSDKDEDLDDYGDEEEDQSEEEED